jgi:CubicO group peptidase (beta-lactamase class C family)
VRALAAVALAASALSTLLAQTATPQPTADLRATVREEVERRAQRDIFSGAVLIAQRERPLFSAAYGLADRERHVANTVNTRFRLGSMNKMFTAVAMLSLVEAGKVALDDPLGKHLPDYPEPEVRSTVTLRHLLMHTGGTGDIFGPQFWEKRLALRTHADYLVLYGTRTLLFEPGAEWRYSNYGYVLLGAIIERVSGRSYYDYVRDRVYAPAGMTSTGSEPEDTRVPDRAVGYTKRGSGQTWASNVHTLPYRGMAAGGGYSTTTDLLRFATALTSNRLLNAKHTASLMATTVATPGGTYGLGFMGRDYNGVRAFGHGGGAPGMNGELLIFPSGYVVVVLANMDPPAATEIARFIAARIPAK